MSKHTPTPWRIRDDFGGGWIQGSPSVGETYGERVCNLAKPKRIGKANAAFIIKAVNNHDALMAALREIEDIVTDTRLVDRLKEIEKVAQTALLFASSSEVASAKGGDG